MTDLDSLSRRVATEAGECSVCHGALTSGIPCPGGHKIPRQQRKIKHAAIRLNNIVYVGKRHHNCIAIMIECGLPAPIKGEQGFVTDEGKFVTREEAFVIASAARQIKGEPHRVGTLFSEDLY